jgi:hypothetical protein
MLPKNLVRSHCTTFVAANRGKDCPPPVLSLVAATISACETDRDLVLARSEHGQRGAQQSEQYVDGA